MSKKGFHSVPCNVHVTLVCTIFGKCLPFHELLHIDLTSGMHGLKVRSMWGIAMVIAIAIGFCFSHLFHWGSSHQRKKMRETKPMAMAMPTPILNGTFWYFFKMVQPHLASSETHHTPKGALASHVHGQIKHTRLTNLCKRLSMAYVQIPFDFIIGLIK